MSRLDIGPGYRQEALEFDGDHKVLDDLIVNLIGDLPLSQLEGNISNDHQGDVD